MMKWSSLITVYSPWISKTLYCDGLFDDVSIQRKYKIEITIKWLGEAVNLVGVLDFIEV
jgi:hypothetical protein